MNKLAAVLAGFASCSASAQLVIGDNQKHPTIWYIDLATNQHTSLLTSGTAAACGLAYDGVRNTLYWNNSFVLYKSDFAKTGLTPIGPFIIHDAVTNAQLDVSGLAYDANDDKLVGYCTAPTQAFYDIDWKSGAATKIASAPSNSNFGGLDYDPVTRAFYASNDGNGAAGSGVYRITDMFTAPVYTKIAPYPVNAGLEIDGLAVGGGKAYLVHDTATNGLSAKIQQLDLATATYQQVYTSPFTETTGIEAGATFVPPDHCAADLDLDTSVDLGDFFVFFNWFAAGDSRADLDRSHEVDLGDFFAFFDHFDAGC